MKDEKQQLLEARIALEQSENTINTLLGKKVRFRFTDKLNLVPEPPICSLCNKGKNQVGEMLTIKLDNICDECIIMLYDNLEGSS